MLSSENTTGTIPAPPNLMQNRGAKNALTVGQEKYFLFQFCLQKQSCVLKMWLKQQGKILCIVSHWFLVCRICANGETFASSTLSPSTFFSFLNFIRDHFHYFLMNRVIFKFRPDNNIHLRHNLMVAFMKRYFVWVLSRFWHRSLLN